MIINVSHTTHAKVIRATLTRAAKHLHCVKNTAISVIFVGDSKMRQLNRKYRGKDKTTNVLAFEADNFTPPLTPPRQGGEIGTIFSPAGGGRRRAERAQAPGVRRGGSKDLGDIFISIPEAKREAKKYGWTLQYEIARLALHGFLHLLGYDHIQDKEAKVMEKIEKEILMSLTSTNVEH